MSEPNSIYGRCGVGWRTHSEWLQAMRRENDPQCRFESGHRPSTFSFGRRATAVGCYAWLARYGSPSLIGARRPFTLASRVKADTLSGTALKDKNRFDLPARFYSSRRTCGFIGSPRLGCAAGFHFRAALGFPWLVCSGAVPFLISKSHESI